MKSRITSRKIETQGSRHFLQRGNRNEHSTLTECMGLVIKNNILTIGRQKTASHKWIY